MQAVDMEIKGWVIRTASSEKPFWLKQDEIGDGKQLFDASEVEADAYVFTSYEDAKTAADIWSDAPGQWIVERFL